MRIWQFYPVWITPGVWNKWSWEKKKINIADHHPHVWSCWLRPRTTPPLLPKCNLGSKPAKVMIKNMIKTFFFGTPPNFEILPDFHPKATNCKSSHSSCCQTFDIEFQAQGCVSCFRHSDKWSGYLTSKEVTSTDIRKTRIRRTHVFRVCEELKSMK